MDKNRKESYEKIEEMRQSKLIVYVTSDRIGFGASISDDAVNYILKHLDSIGKVDKISLYLYTLGGGILAAWNIVNLIRQFCDELEIIVPWKARSAGTLICLGADKIIMTKQATLGPIDPSFYTNNLNISVEEVQSFLELAKNELNIKDDMALSNIYNVLANQIHPLLLGKAYRTRGQIQMLARKLLKYQLKDETKINNVISFLCSESGSHDYTIDRVEAKNELGLNIEKPDDNLYGLINDIYNSISEELGLSEQYNLELCLGNNLKKEYLVKNIVIESLYSDSCYYILKGEYIKVSDTQSQELIPGKPLTLSDEKIYNRRSYTGWISKSELGKINNYTDYII